MSARHKVFLDSDVVISSLLSSKGAARFLMETEKIERSISTRSHIELTEVAARLDIARTALDNAIKKHCTVIALDDAEETIQMQYASCVNDHRDAHIVAGTVAAKAGFLISYNQKHFQREALKNHHGIILMTPALFLQYLRSEE